MSGMTPEEIKKAFPDASQMIDAPIWFIHTTTEPEVGRPVHQFVLEDICSLKTQLAEAQNFASALAQAYKERDEAKDGWDQESILSVHRANQLNATEAELTLSIEKVKRYKRALEIYAKENNWRDVTPAYTKAIYKADGFREAQQALEEDQDD